MERHPHSFERFIAEFEPQVRTHLRRRLGPALAVRIELDDLIQETRVEAWKKIDTFEWRSRAATLAWLKQIGNFVILNAARRHGREDIVYLADVVQEGSDFLSEARKLRRRERLERMRAALHQLPPDYREAVQLVRLDGLKVKDAAERMGRSSKSVMHLLMRAMKKLKTIFGDTESLGLPPEGLQNDDQELPGNGDG